MSSELTDAQWSALMAVVNGTEQVEISWLVAPKTRKDGTPKEGEKRKRECGMISVGRAWLYVARLVALGHEETTIRDLVECKPAWLKIWRRSDGDAVTLTEWATERLGVEIDEHWEVGCEEDGTEGVRNGKPVRRKRGMTEEPHWTVAIPETDVDGQRTKKQRRPIRLPRQRRLVPLSESMHDRPGREPDPVARAIESEEYLLQEKKRDDGRPLYDRATGKIIKTPVYLWGEPVKIDPRLIGKRPGPKRKTRTE